MVTVTQGTLGAASTIACGLLSIRSMAKPTSHTRLNASEREFSAAWQSRWPNFLSMAENARGEASVWAAVRPPSMISSAAKRSSRSISTPMSPPSGSTWATIASACGGSASIASPVEE